MGFELHGEGHVPASPGRVWARLLDREAAPRLFEEVRAIVADGDELLLHIGGGGWVRARVSVAEPRRRLRVRLEAPRAGLRWADVELRLFPDVAGTRFEVSVAGTPTLLGMMALPLLRLHTEVAMARALRGFRAALEAGRTGRPRTVPVARPPLVRPSAEVARLLATAAP